MKKLILAIAILVAVPGFAQNSRIVTDSIHSNLLGAVQNYNVYLPQGYNAGTHYPVIYLLHGLWGCYQDWDKAGQMKRVADQLMASGECVPAVIVMPNAGDKDVHNYQNGYFNVQDWPYEDYFFTEFLPEVESKYNCGGSKGQRAIVGLSMGGGGSVVYAQRHPDMFSSSYAMSAWLEHKSRDVRGLDIPGSKLTILDRSVEAHSALDFIDNADSTTIARLKTVKWLIDCGDDDSLLPMSESLHQKMRARGLKAEFRVRDGGHTWEYWHSALHTALAFASRNMVAVEVNN